MIALAGCTRVSGNGPAGGRHVWTQPEVLRVGMQVSPENLDPLLSSNTTSAVLNRLSFDLLVDVDERGRPVPDLATIVPTLANGGISSDERTYTYHLRHGVTWQDGAPFTSRDVAFSWHAIMSTSNNVLARTGFEHVARIETPDDFTVVVHLKAPFAPFANEFFAESDSPIEVVPEHILAKYPNVNQVPFNGMPIGTGPFRVVEWVRGDHLDLVANPRYFLGAPKLRRIHVVFYPDENTELNALRTHDIDWQFEASPQEYRDLKTLAGTLSVLQVRNQYERLEMNVTHPPLDDVRVRQAIAYALDSQRLTDALTFGSATRADEDLPPFLWAHSEDVAHYPHDVARAKALLASAGWTPGPDGIVRKNGRRLSLTLVTNTTNATRRTGVVQAQEMLGEAGIAVETKLYQGALLFAPLGEGGILQKGDFDLAWTGWVAGSDPDDSSLVICSARPPNGNNDFRYCNPALDAAEAEALSTTRQSVRKAGYVKVEKILTRDLPFIAIWWPRQVQPINPDFQHFTPNPVSASWNAYQWDI